MEALAVDVPRLADGQPVRAHLRGRVDAGTTHMPFDVAATLLRPAADAGLGVAGTVEVQRTDWRMPLDLVLRGRPDLAQGLALDRLVMRAKARYVSRSSTLPFGLGIAGRAAYAGGLHLAPFGLAIRQGRDCRTSSPAVGWTGHPRWHCISMGASRGGRALARAAGTAEPAEGPAAHGCRLRGAPRTCRATPRSPCGPAQRVSMDASGCHASLRGSTRPPRAARFRRSTAASPRRAWRFPVRRSRRHRGRDVDGD